MAACSACSYYNESWLLAVASMDLANRALMKHEPFTTASIAKNNSRPASDFRR